MRLRFVLAIVSGAVFGGVVPAASADVWRNLEPGPHVIGFHVIHELDTSRSALREQAAWPASWKRGRFMQVGVWLPARSGTRCNKMSWKDYMLLRGHEMAFDPDARQVRAAAIASLSDAYEFGAAEAGTLLDHDAPMRACRGAQAQTGSFPVVILLHSSLDGFALLGEYLASHGYVVAAPAKTGSFEKELDWRTVTGVAVEARDAEFVLSVASRFPSADVQNVAAGGHSYGAQSAAAYMTRTPAVKALVSLDGGIGSTFGAGLLTQTAYFDPIRMNRPILHVWTDRDGGFDFAALDGFKYAARLYAKKPSLRHMDFVTLGMAKMQFLNRGGDGGGGRGTAYKGEFASYYRDVLVFLNAVFKSKRDPTKELASLADAGDSYTFRPPAPTPPSADALFTLYERNGVSVLVKRQKDLSKDDPQALPYSVFSEMTRRLFNARHYKAMRDWTRAFAASYPDSAEAVYMVARAEGELGNGTEAETHYRKAIERLAWDPYLSYFDRIQYLKAARRRLAELE